MKSAPANLPKVGTTIHDPVFGGGCTLRVTKVHKPSANRGWRVSVRIVCDDGHVVNMPTRCWGYATWLLSAARATPPESRTGEGHE